MITTSDLGQAPAVAPVKLRVITSSSLPAEAPAVAPAAGVTEAPAAGPAKPAAKKAK